MSLKEFFKILGESKVREPDEPWRSEPEIPASKEVLNGDEINATYDIKNWDKKDDEKNKRINLGCLGIILTSITVEYIVSQSVSYYVLNLKEEYSVLGGIIGVVVTNILVYKAGKILKILISQRR